MMRTLIALTLLLTMQWAVAVDTLQFKDAAEEQRFQALTRELRCLVCQNQNLADSDAGLAKDLRQEVYEQLRNGKSDAQIKQYLTSRYSDFVLYDPPLRAKTWLLWFGPVLLLLIGGVVVLIAVRRRAQSASATAGAVAATNQNDEEDW